MRIFVPTSAALLLALQPSIAPAQSDSSNSGPGAAIAALTHMAEVPPGPLAGPPRIPVTSQTPPANAADISFVLTAITLAGGTIYPKGLLAAIYGDRIGTTVTLLDLFSIAAQLQDRYREDGYLFTRVLVPAQDINGGAVLLELIEAVIEEVVIEEPAGPLGPVRALADVIIAPLIGRANPRLTDIEATLLRLNDIPGVTRAAAVPKLGGDLRGGVRLFVNMERTPLEAVIFVDNRQSPVIGTGLYGVVASWSSWSRWGDSTTISAFGSGDFDDDFPDDFEERWTVQLEHSRFIGSSGLSLRLRGLYSETRPGDAVSDFNIRGTQREFEAGFLYPLRRTRALSADLSLGLEVIEVDSLVPASDGGAGLVTADDAIRAAYLGASLVQRDAWGASEAEVELRLGLDIFGASRPEDEGLSRSDGDGQFMLIRGHAARTLTVPDLAPFSFWGEVRAQWADRALLSPEEFAIGGPTLARAYDPSEYSGDNGIGVTVEIRVPANFSLFAQPIGATLYAFGDAAEISNLAGGAPAHSSLISAGFGVRAVLPAGGALNLEAAKPINQPLARTSSDAWRFFFSASKQF